MDAFREAYEGLNIEQKKAVDTIEGPVMVIAGPGTGKTQVLALRIAHILATTDTPPDGILCLTFTNAGVTAMRTRLIRYIGPVASRVRIATFHGYGMKLIEDHYAALGLSAVPATLDDATTVALLDELLQKRDWQYLRPRHNPAFYFRSIKSLISLLKRERISPADFIAALKTEIEHLSSHPDSISSRGESKGKLKKDVERKIEGLYRSIECAEFYLLYEEIKTERNLIDFNDVLEYMVRLVEESDEVRSQIREQSLYVLVDEHQDSSGIQNEFLEKVWKDVEKPNIFVVGDDRQLIYGFGGASLAYFEGFKHAFGQVSLITLTANYRSTQTILDSAEALLQSALAEGKLIGSTNEAHLVRLIETEYPRDEIIMAGKAIKESGVDLDQCAILVPKNRQVKAAMQILNDLGLPVAAESRLKLFELPDTQVFLAILRVLINPYDVVSISQTLLDPVSDIMPLDAHRFLHETDLRALSIDSLVANETTRVWGEKLQTWLTLAQSDEVYTLLQRVGSDVLLLTAANDTELRRRVEIIRTMLHLVLSQLEQGERITLPAFLTFIDRLEQYGEDIPLAVFAAQQGVKVLTLHGSKGLEFDFVWIAHMDERSLTGSLRSTFTLPEAIAEKVEERDEEKAKRQLYVAMTRAKRFCRISYARHAHTGAAQQLASIIATLPEALLERHSILDTDTELLAQVADVVTLREPVPRDGFADFTKTVRESYSQKSVSVTLLNNFFECPWKWYFRNLLQLPEPESDSIHVGNLVHASIEYALQGKKDTAAVLAFVSERALRESRYNEALAMRLVSAGEIVMKDWLEMYKPTLIEPYDIERSISYRDPEIPEFMLHGKIDLIEPLEQGMVRVTDWKTGSGKTKADIERTDEEGRMSGLLRQLAMYSYLLNGAHSTQVAESRLIFVEEGTTLARVIGHGDIARLREDIKDYRQSIESGEWVRRSCCAKTYGDGVGCQYCALASRFGAITTPK
jgi:DNA helicase II / ATP-dependent DNA helicase PcrA